jgi:hypothetical protein
MTRLNLRPLDVAPVNVRALTVGTVVSPLHRARAARPIAGVR